MKLVIFLTMIFFTSCVSEFKEMSTYKFHDVEIRAWNAGRCYVFGVKPPKDNPVFFSNCHK